MDFTQIHKIRTRQLARFLTHLEKTGQLTPGLESDVKRAYRFVFEDIETAIEGRDKENLNGKIPD
jgi:ribosome biogenesis GTPase A